MSTWEIKGQAGKALNSTVRSFEAAGVSREVLRMPKLAVETFTYEIDLLDLTVGSEKVPDEGQEVSIFLNGARIFWGHATRRQSGFIVIVTVRNPWYWLEGVNFTSVIADSTGATAERLSFQHPSQSLTTSLTNTLNRAIALGVPMQIGNLAATFAAPRITLNQMSLASAITEIVRKTADMSAWWDYSGSGYPTFNTSRRSTADVTAFSAEDLDPGWDIGPVPQTRITQVVIPFSDRDPVTGKTRYREQSSGDSGTAQAGAANTITLRAGASKSDDAYKGLTISITSGTGAGQTKTILAYNGTTKVATVNSAWATNPNNTSGYVAGTGIATTGQLGIVTGSGPEVDTFIPSTKYDTFNLQTSETTGTPLVGWSIVKDSEFSDLAKKYSFTAATWPMNLATNAGVTLFTTANTFGQLGTPKTYPMSAPTFTKADGTASTLTGKNLIFSEKVPEWATQFIVEEVTMAASFYYLKTETVWTSSTNSQPVPDPLWVADVNWSLRQASAGLTNGNFGKTSGVTLFRKDISVRGYLINTSAPAVTAIYRPADYTFIFPPDGFAKGLADSQNFTRFEGTFSITEEVGGTYLVPGNVVNVTDALPELATMKALIAEIVLEPSAGRTTFRLGAPDRLSYNQFIDAVRPNATDNVVINI